MYILFFLFLLILSLNQQSSVYASIEIDRKHSTAHYFKNGTVIILGGVKPKINNTANVEFASPIISLLFDPKDLSLTSTTTTDATPLLQPITGHTSHYNSTSGSIFSVFGMHRNQQYTPLIQYYPSLSPPLKQQKLSGIQQNLIGRQHHTSVYINSTLYVFGGHRIQDQKKRMVNELMIIHENQTFRTIPFPSISGHSTITYRHWLISCFGQQEQSLNTQCIWFDTESLSITNLSSTFLEGPATRMFASVIPIKQNQFLLYGGETNENELLDDIWELVITQPFEMIWRKIEDIPKGRKRSGHVGVLLSDDTVLYYGGSGADEEESSHFFNITTMNWIETHAKRTKSHIKRAEEISPTSASLNGGAIAGIIIGVLIFLGIVFLFWRQYSQKRIPIPSRATQFQPQIPLQHPIVNQISPPLAEQKSQQPQPRQSQQQFTLSLPEIALSSDSRLSLGPNFGYLAESNKSETSLQSNNESKNRSSSIFPARKSYLYPPPTPRTPDSAFSNHVRGSVSAKSVSSIQWVGFNEGMDYGSNEFHLSIANRASNYYSDTSAQTTPCSPVFFNK